MGTGTTPQVWFHLLHFVKRVADKYFFPELDFNTRASAQFTLRIGIQLKFKLYKTHADISTS
jgi:hypothetical protein